MTVPGQGRMNRVLVIGGINLDIKAKTLGAHVLATSNPAAVLTKPGGVGRNIAHNLGALGVPVSLLSVVGNDAQGAAALAATQAAGVDVSAVLKHQGSTGIYLAVLDHSGELVTAASDMAALEALTPEMIDAHKQSITDARYVVADCNLSLEALQAIAAIAGDKMIVEPVSVSKCEKLKALLQSHRVFLATPNVDQMITLTGLSDPEAAGKELRKMGLSAVVIHHGSRGAFTYNGVTLHHVPIGGRKIVDVTGAGDAATAGLVAGLMQGLSLHAAAQMGQGAAAKVMASEFSTLVGP